MGLREHVGFFGVLLIGFSLVAGDCNDGSCFTSQWPWYKAYKLNKTAVDATTSYFDAMSDETDRLCSMWNAGTPKTQVLLLDDISKLPDECDRLKICSSNVCIVFGRESWLFALVGDRTLFPESPPIQLDPNVTILQAESLEVTNSMGYSSDFDPKYRMSAFTSKSIHTVFSNIDMDPSILAEGMKFLNLTMNTDCSKYSYGLREVEISTSSTIDVGCSTFMLCNKTRCMLYTLNALPFATIMYKNTSHITNKMLPFCASTQAGSLGRRTLGGVPISQTSDSGLRFNLPYYRFCGPGNSIAAMDDAGGPINEVDDACREHDLAYMLGADPEVADLQLLTAIRKSGSWLYPLFAIAMESKRYFEKITGYKYTSYLYYVEPEISTTTVHYFYYNSAYDSAIMGEDEKAIGRYLENRWRSLVDDVWRGYCYKNSYSSDDEEMPSGSPSSSENVTPPPTGCTSGNAGGDPEPEDIDDAMEAASQDAYYPIPPKHMDPCRVVINELASRNTENSNQYIELTRVCPTEAPRTRVRSLKGYRIHLIENGDPPKLHITASLDGLNLKEVSEVWKGKTSRTNYYFLLGVLEDGEVQLKINRRNTIQSRIPPGNQGSFAVILTHDTGDKQLPRPVIPMITSSQVDVTPEQMLFLKQTMQDILVYGTKCEEGCDYLRSLLARVGEEGSLKSERVSDVAPDGAGRKNYASINRCTTSLLPMQPEAWEESVPTPGFVNKCPVMVKAPFPFASSEKLQSSARKLAMNVYNFFEASAKDQEILNGSPAELTSRSTTLSRSSIARIRQELEETGELRTPAGRKRPRHQRVMAKFDNFAIDLIKRTIQGYYQRNTAPLIKDVYKDIVAALEEDKTRKKFSLQTFRKLLKQIGFHYGRINLRDVILQRPDIVSKRWTFLEAMRENENGPNLPVVYTDESWIDPHSRVGKAIVPIKGRMSYEERVKYSYQKHKVSRGSRLIVLHAGGSDGMIHDVMTVYPVGGSKLAYDYHQNVDHITYMSFMTKLFTVLQAKGPHIIVIDNAPYHSKSHAPKQATRKAEMETWLNEYDADGSLSGRVIGKKYLKPEIWSQVLKVKDKIEHHLIDLEAKKYGHRILRLPPYECQFNPIEYVWSDVKRKVKAKNTEQTIESAKMHAEQEFLVYTAQEFQAHEQHTKRLREEAWMNDNFYDRFLDHFEPVIVPLDVPTTDESEEDYTNETFDYGDPNEIYAMMHNEGVIEIEVNDDDDGTETARRRLNLSE